MFAGDALSPDDEQLLPLVIAIADGTPVDWPPAPPPLLKQLQQLERLVRAHEATRSSPSGDGAVLTHETLLTEARRKAAGLEHPLRVSWGPLVVHEKIGRGSFGDVYRAWDPRLDREVALKLIPEDISAAAASPVVEEGRLLARVRHPNVMVVYGAERIDGRVGLWTEYIRGETLASEVARRGPLPAEEAMRIGADVCAALGAVHAAGLLHRDVKAQNILRDVTGRIVLGDFGTGVELADDAGVSDPQIAGSPLYLAPEVIDGKPATIASDLYGVGVLLYLLVSGAYPVRGRTLAEIKRAHSRHERVSPRAARPDLPDALVSIIETLLAFDPDRRYQSAGVTEAALRRCLEQPPGAHRRFGGRLAAAAVAGALVVASLSASALWRYRSHSPTDRARQSPLSLTLKPGDWIVVADFDNHTGESVLDGTLRAAVDRELEYSDFVRVAQRDRIEDALKLLERPLDSRLDRDLALQLAQRDGGIHAVVSGAIAKADGGYTLTLDTINPATGTPLPTLTDHAPAQSDVLAAVRRQVLRIRETFGEPATSIEQSREAFQRASLPSLEALNLFARAEATISLRPLSPVSEWVTIERTAREVIQADATFPGGPILLAWALTNQGRGKEGQEHRERALLLADNATPQERYVIIASVHGANARFPGGGRLLQRNREQPATRWANIAQPRELEKAAAAMEALFALQPDHYAIKGNLRNVYQILGRERDLAWMNLRLADARPWSVDVNLEVANQLVREGNVDGARRYGARAESALSRGSAAADPNLAAGVRLFRAYVAWLQDDPAETLRTLNQVAASSAKLPDTERRQLYLRTWSLYAAVGRLQAAEQAIEAIRPTDRDDLENTIVADMARADLLEDRGDLARLRELAATAWRDPLPVAARPMLATRVTFLIEAGLVDAAERDLQWFKQRTADPSAWRPRLPARQFEPFYASTAGAIQLARGRPAEAAAALREVMPAVRDAPPPILGAGGSQGQYAAVKLAAALEAIGNVSEAIATLEQAVADRVGVTIANTPNRWVRANAQLARLYRKNGEEAKARAIEARLLKLLAAADADHRLVMELRGRR